MPKLTTVTVTLRFTYNGPTTRSHALPEGETALANPTYAPKVSLRKRLVGSASASVDADKQQNKKPRTTSSQPIIYPRPISVTEVFVVGKDGVMPREFSGRADDTFSVPYKCCESMRQVQERLEVIGRLYANHNVTGGIMIRDHATSDIRATTALQTNISVNSLADLRTSIVALTTPVIKVNLSMSKPLDLAAASHARGRRVLGGGHCVGHHMTYVIDDSASEAAHKDGHISIADLAALLDKSDRDHQDHSIQGTIEIYNPSNFDPNTNGSFAISNHEDLQNIITAIRTMQAQTVAAEDRVAASASLRA